VENFAQVSRHSGTVWIGGHNIAHVLPPLLALGGLGNSLSPRLVLDRDTGKELANRHY